jgi:HEAT repeat protein
MGFVKGQHANVEHSQERQGLRDLTGLRESLRNDDPFRRRWAARDLIAYPTAIDALLSQLRVESDREVRAAIFTTLSQFDNLSAAKGLISFLHSEDVALRNNAIDALKLMPSALAPLMDDLLQDPSTDVRILAVNVLESLRHPQVEQWLIRVVTQDPHVNVCATAVDLLSEVGTQAAVQPLLTLKSRFSAEPFMHFAIDVALKRIQGE